MVEMTFAKITVSRFTREEGRTRERGEKREESFFYGARDKSGFPNCERVPYSSSRSRCFLLYLHGLSLFVSVEDSSEAAEAERRRSRVIHSLRYLIQRILCLTGV